MQTKEGEKTVAIVGATGLIGKAVHSALWGGRPCISLGRAPTDNRFLDLSAKFQPEILSGVDVLIHAAGVRDEDIKGQGPDGVDRAVRQSVNLFKAAFDSGCRKFVYVSTAHVYGQLRGTISESSPVNPQSPYAEVHARVEEALCDLARSNGCQSLVLRPNAVFGISFDPERFSRWHLIPFAFPLAAVWDGRLDVKVPSASRNFVSSQDIAECVGCWLHIDASDAYQIVNPIGPEQVTVGAFAQKCADEVLLQTGAEVAINFGSSGADPFLYTTLHEFSVGRIAVDEFLREYIVLCRKRDLRQSN